LLQSGSEDRGDVQALLGAVVITASLRLRHAGRQVGVDGRRQPQAQVPGRGRVGSAAQGHHGRQHAQVSCTGLTPAVKFNTGLLWLLKAKFHYAS